ncbi:MAG: DUF2062 domain-containing protein [Paracoccaceae bacterium]|nr:DUF2062 domain-containing protein [Paracoccaceae bacterium]
MVFKRRTPRSWLQFIAEGFWPRGGWARASRYVVHRLRRLPDPAHKISRGIAAGVFVSFTPFFGFHFLISAAIALMIRGNVLAALLATFVGNPITFPIFASIAMEIGSWVLGTPHIGAPGVIASFSNASAELWHNFTAIFTPEVMHWGRLGAFFEVVFLPYLVGGILPGLLAGAAAYFLSHPVIVAYQKARIKRQKARYEKKRAKAAARAAKPARPAADPAE